MSTTMNDTPKEQSSRRRLVTVVGLAIVFGWIGHSAVNAIVLDLVRPASAFGPRLQHHGFDLGRHVLLAMLTAVAAEVWIRRVGTSTKAALLAIACVATVALWAFAAEDLRRPGLRLARRLGTPPVVGHAALIVVTAQAITIAALLAKSLRRPFGPLLLALAVAGTYYVNAFKAGSRLPGLHLMLSTVGAVLLAGCARQLLAKRLERIAEALSRRPFVTATVVVLSTTFGVGAIAWTPRTTTQLDINRWGPTLFANIVGNATSIVPLAPDLTAVELDAGYYVSRQRRPAVQPTSPPLLATPPIVILLTVDALRADVVAEQPDADYLQGLLRLKNDGAYFPEARSPSAATVVSLATMSTGKYFSQLRWEEYETDDWLPNENATHFPQLLTDAGVATWLFAGAPWQAERFGMMRGFEHVSYKKGKSKFTHGKTLTTRIIRLLKKQKRDQPLFIYCHYFDPHHPYTRGEQKTGPPWERYLSEVELVSQQIARLRRWIEKLGLTDRTFVILTADHGEAFDDHGVKHKHAVNLYEELIRVPLVVVGPGIEPHHVPESVGLIDLGPTVLDLFGVSTPGDVMGQSLVPCLAGRCGDLDRPIIVEGLQKQAIVMRNGTKLIRDNRAKTIEIYDLRRDPGELTNLSDDLDLRAEPAYQRLYRFFEEHTYREDGYVHPRR